MNDSHPADAKNDKAGSFWARLSPLYKKRLLQGIAAYLLLMLAVGGWLFAYAGQTRDAWNARIPQAVITLPQDAAAIDDADVTVAGTDTPANTQNPPPVAVNLPAGKTAVIALILSDAGLSEAATLRAMQKLPAPVAFAFSPYATRLQPLMEQAKTSGRQTLLLLPMEPLSYPKDDPGPRALLLRKSDAENIAGLQSLLALGKPDAVMNFMGSRFLGDQQNMLNVMEQLKRRSLPFVENPSMSGLQSAASYAHEVNVPYISADIQIDANPVPNDIRQQLYQLEKAAETKGYALGIASPYPVTLDIVAEWAEGLEKRGFTLATPLDVLKTAATTPRTP